MSSNVERAISAIRDGELVIVTDDENRENEGDLIMAAQAATREKIAFFLRHTSGVICVSLPGERLDALHLPLMVEQNRESQGTAFTVSVDAAVGITTGISAADRAATIQTLADPGAGAQYLVRPGHVFPLRSKVGGVLSRAGHTECLTGDVFGSRRCDCGAQLNDALHAIANEGHGVVVYLLDLEATGVG